MTHTLNSLIAQLAIAPSRDEAEAHALIADILAIAPATDAKPVAATTGPALLKALHERGIPASKATRNRYDGSYVIQFYQRHAANQDGKVWAARIADAVPNANVYDEYTTRCEYLPGKPVFSVLVYVRLASVKQEAA